jgi:hypothetical protein
LFWVVGWVVAIWQMIVTPPVDNYMSCLNVKYSCHVLFHEIYNVIGLVSILLTGVLNIGFENHSDFVACVSLFCWLWFGTNCFISNSSALGWISPVFLAFGIIMLWVVLYRLLLPWRHLA